MKKIILSLFTIFLGLQAHGQSVTKNVLFIGNSYSYDVPALLQSLASSAGDNLTYGKSTPTVGGYSFYMHSQDANTLALIQQGGWDVVVLQEKSTNPSESLDWVEQNVYPYAEFLVDQISTYSSAAEKMFYMTWGRENGDATRCPTNPDVCTYIGMDDLTRERYMYMAATYHATISPVGPVWRYIRSHYPGVELYQPDGSHPSDYGLYASACTFYAAIFRKDPTQITYNYTLDATVASEIRNAAKLVVTDSLLTWHIGEYNTDNQVPSVPSGLSYSNLSVTGFTLSWTASTDNVGVTGYQVYQNGSLAATVSTNSAAISGLSASTTYSMTVKAKDAAGNISDASTALNVTTPAPDTQAPTVPAGLSASNIGETGLNLSWTASTDNVGVTGYDIYQNGTFLMSVTVNSANISGLSPSTSYSLAVKAKDAAGNISAASSPLSVTTIDISAPSVPSALSPNSITQTSFNVTWNASTDNVGVTGYDVFLNGTLSVSVTATSASFNGLTGGSTYTITIKAKDAAGNISQASTALYVTTGSTDTQAPSVPSGLSASGISENSFTLSWTASTDNTGVTGYDVFLNGTLTTSVTGISAAISGLSVYTTYTVAVRAKDAAGNISALSNSLSVTTTDTHAPSVPSGLSASSVAETSFTLSWTSSTDNVAVSGYDVYLNGVMVTSVTGASANIAGLSASTTYSAAVRARDAAGNSSGLSSSLSVTTIDIHAPSVPAGLSATGITETGFTLTWGASTDNVGVSGYDVYNNGILAGSVTATTYSFSGLSAGTSCTLTVRAKDAAGNISSSSTGLSVKTGDTHTPTSPTGLTATAITETSFTLTWNASTDNVGVTGYDVYCNGTLVTSLVGTSANIAGLTASTNYAMTVKAGDAAGNISNASSILNVTTIDSHAPSVPTGLSATNITETSFTLSWTPSTDNIAVTGYDVYLNGTLANSVSGTNTSITGLTLLTSYSMTVRAKDAAGNVSSESSALNVTTTDTHSPSAPTNLTSDNITETSFTLAWTASSDNVGVTGYDVYCNGKLANTVTETSVILSGLAPATVYTMTIRAKDGAGNFSSPSNSLDVKTTDTHAPTPPASLVADDLTETSFTLSWSASSDNVGVTGYMVFMDGTQITTVTGLSAEISGLTVWTTYNMTVKAVDAAGNTSDPSVVLSVKTPDTSAPTVPTGLKATNGTKSGFTLSWAGSTDNVSVAGYEVYEDDVLIMTTAETSAYLTHLIDSLDYSFTVIAFDETGNKSKPSNVFNITTKVYNPLNKNTLSSILVYPNPVKGNEFYVLLDREFIGNVDVEILSFEGIILYKQSIGCSGNLITIPETIRRDGSYILKIGSQNTFITRKIIINKML